MELLEISDLKTIAGDYKRKTEAYEATGTVTKIDGSTVYVRLEGSDVETPVESSTVTASVGDVVNVSVSHHDTHITGNRTDPAASSTALDETRSKLSFVDAIVRIINSSISVIDSAISVINSRIRVRDNVLEFLDEVNDVVASFGERIRLGNAENGHVDLDEDSLGFGVGESTVASYGLNKIQLGNNATTSRIEFCNNSAYLSAGTNSASLYKNEKATNAGYAGLVLNTATSTTARGYGYLQYWKGSAATAGVSAASNGVYLYGGSNGVYVTDSWRDSEIDSNAHRRLALTADMFAETTTTVINGVTVASGGSLSETASAVAPSGGTWYPLCISSWYAGSRFELLARARLTGKGANKCTINIAIQNTSSASRACSMDIYVLWARMY